MIRLTTTLLLANTNILRKIQPYRLLFRFNSSNNPSSKYAKKTSKQIDKDIAVQKWKAMQNTYRSLSTNFGLKKPTSQQLINIGKKYATPKTIKYDLQTLRQCSREYPIYLYHQLRNKTSPFHKVIDAILENLWKAEKKQTLEILQFLHQWGYKGINIFSMYTSTIQRVPDIDTFDLFLILRKFYHSKNQQQQLSSSFQKQKPNNSLQQLVQVVQLKLLTRIQQNSLVKQQYGNLLRIINLMTVNDILSEQFYYAVTRAIKDNINSISPQDSLTAYIYFTYNKQDTPLNFQLESKNNAGSKQQKQKQQQPQQISKIVQQLLIIIQKRVFAMQCIKFYKVQEIVALLHTFLKNCVLRGIPISHSKQNQLNPDRQYFNQNIEKLVTRIQLLWYTGDFTVQDKKNILKIIPNLPLPKRQLIVALFHQSLLKSPQKTQCDILVQIYLASYQSNNLPEEVQRILQNKIVEDLYNLNKEDVSRAAWLLTITQASNMKGFYKKIQNIVLGGLKSKGYQIKQVAVLVWALGYQIENINSPSGTAKTSTTSGLGNQQFWRNIQDFIYSQLTNKKCAQQQMISNCNWVLWAYLNNIELSLKTFDKITQILIQILSVSRANYELSPFQLTNITSFYHTIEYPPEFMPLLKSIKSICYTQFIKIYKQMSRIQLLRVLKYISQNIWSEEEVGENLLQMFNVQIDQMNYMDVMGVMGLLMGLENRNVQKLGSKLRKVIIRLNQRKKRLESVEQVSEGK